MRSPNHSQRNMEVLFYQGILFTPGRTRGFIKPKGTKKIAAVVYLYQVDNDGEWGEISFDFEAGTAEIIRLAEWDSTVSKKFAKQVIYHLQTSPNYNLPKDGVMIFEI